MRTGPPPYSISDPKDWGQLAEPLRSRLLQARSDCHAAHPTWVLLGLNSGKRTDWMQYGMRVGRVPRGEEWNPAYHGFPLTAIPGRSNHRNLGLVDGRYIEAADLYQNQALTWLHQHQADYGIHFPLPSEYWHAEVHGTPRVHITAFKGTPTTTPNVPHVPTPPKPTPPGELTMEDAVKKEFDAVNLRIDALDKKVDSIRSAVITDIAEAREQDHRNSIQEGSTRGYLFALAEALGHPKDKLAAKAGEYDKEDTFGA